MPGVWFIFVVVISSGVVQANCIFQLNDDKPLKKCLSQKRNEKFYE